MSVQAMTRVLEHSRATTAARLVLLVLANHETEDRGAFPALERLARECRLSVRQVQRHIRSLVELGELGLIEGGGPKGTNLYHVLIGGDTSVGGDIQGPQMSPERKEQKTLTSIESPSDSLPRRGSAFDRFWKAYPVKVEKAGARSKFARLVAKGIEPETIIAGAERYRDDPNREAGFTKHPTTWLNNGCWEDEPLPPRHEQRGYESAATRGLRKIAARREARNGDGPGESGRAGLPAGAGLSRPAD